MKESYGISQDERFTPRQLSEVIGCSVQQLSYWRKHKKGPPYIKMEGRYFYPKIALEEYLQRNLHNV